MGPFNGEEPLTILRTATENLIVLFRLPSGQEHLPAQPFARFRTWERRYTGGNMPKARPSKEFVAFDGLMGKLLTVDKTTVQAKVDAHRAEAAKNPRKRGPKPKVKPSASGESASPDAT